MEIFEALGPSNPLLMPKGRYYIQTTGRTELNKFDGRLLLEDSCWKTLAGRLLLEDSCWKTLAGRHFLEDTCWKTLAGRHLLEWIVNVLLMWCLGTSAIYFAKFDICIWNAKTTASDLTWFDPSQLPTQMLKTKWKTVTYTLMFFGFFGRGFTWFLSWSLDLYTSNIVK